MMIRVKFGFIRNFALNRISNCKKHAWSYFRVKPWGLRCEMTTMPLEWVFGYDSMT